MLFDIRGRRRRLIQVVYALLAVLFLVGFVGFGVGGTGTGGILDAIGIGGGDSGTSNPQFDEDIDQAEARLKKNPKDEQALLTLAEVNYAAGNSSSETDTTTGQVTVTDEARADYQASTAAWERYLKLNPSKPNAGTAAQVLRAYQALIEDQFTSTQPDTAALQAQLEGAATTAKIQAENVGGPNTWFAAAQFAYLAGETADGDAAAQKALAEASGSDRKQLQKQLAQIKKAGPKLQKQLAQAGPGKEALTSPLGGVGGSTPSPTGAPGAPPAP